MPIMNGWHVFDKLKSNNEWRNIPVIFISSVAYDKDIMRALESGDSYIEKPFTTDILMDKIKKITNKKR